MSVDLLIDSYISRRRWEYHEQAVAHFNIQAEAMGAKTSKNISPRSTSTDTVFRPDNGGVNYGPPPLAALQKMGFEMDM